MYTQKEIESLTTAAIIVSSMAAFGFIIGWLVVRYVKRITDDIQKLYDLHGELPCSDNGKQITRNKTDIDWLKNGGKSNDKSSS